MNNIPRLYDALPIRRFPALTKGVERRWLDWQDLAELLCIIKRSIESRIRLRHKSRSVSTLISYKDYIYATHTYIENDSSNCTGHFRGTRASKSVGNSALFILSVAL